MDTTPKRRENFSDIEKNELLKFAREMYKSNNKIWGNRFWQDLVQLEEYKESWERPWSSAQGCAKKVSLTDPARWDAYLEGVPKFGSVKSSSSQEKPKVAATPQKRGWTKADGKSILMAIIELEGIPLNLTSDEFWKKVSVNTNIEDGINFREVKNYFFDHLSGNFKKYLSPDEVKILDEKLDADDNGTDGDSDDPDLEVLYSSTPVASKTQNVDKNGTPTGILKQTRLNIPKISPTCRENDESAPGISPIKLDKLDNEIRIGSVTGKKKASPSTNPKNTLEVMKKMPTFDQDHLTVNDAAKIVNSYKFGAKVTFKEEKEEENEVKEEQISAGKAKALQNQANRRKKERDLQLKAKEERRIREEKIAAEVARIGADDGRRTKPQAELDETIVMSVVKDSGPNIEEVPSLNIELEKLETDTSSSEGEELDLDEEGNFCILTRLRRKLSKKKSSKTSQGVEKNGKVDENSTTDPGDVTPAGWLGSRLANLAGLGTEAPSEASTVSSKRAAIEQGGSNEPKIPKLDVSLEKHMLVKTSSKEADDDAYSEVFKTLGDIYDGVKEYQSLVPVDKGRGRVKLYYEQSVRGLGYAIEVLLRSVDASDSDMDILADKEVMQEFDYYHHLAATFYRHPFEGLKQLATALVKIAIMARNQIRLLKLANNCKDCSGDVKYLV